MRFESFPSPERHISSLLALSYLYGVRSQPIVAPGAQILEVACGVGTLCLAQALQFPETTWKGIDCDRGAIEEALQRKKALGVNNIDFYHMDFAEMVEQEAYDVVIAHGIYSWIPRPDREVLLKNICAALRSDGIGYVSVNAAPGWDLRGKIAKDAQELVFREEQVSDEEKVFALRKVLEQRYESLQLYSDLKRSQEREEIEQLPGQPDGFLLHEILNPESDACTLLECENEFQAHGLRIVSDAKVSRMRCLDPDAFPEFRTHRERLEAEAASAPSQAQSFRGFLICKQKRECHFQLPLEKLSQLWVASPLVPDTDTVDLSHDVAEAFHGPGGDRLLFSKPIEKAILLLLRRCWPEPLPFQELIFLAQKMLEQNGILDPENEIHTQDVLRKLFFDGYVDFSGTDLHISRSLQGALRIFPLAQEQAKTQHWVTNLRGEQASIHAIEKYVFSLLNGQREKKEIIQLILDAVKMGELQPRNASGEPLTDEEQKTTLPSEVSLVLDGIAEKALLMKEIQR